MTTVPLGVGAYKRSYSGEPEIRLLNRFLEEDPTNLREHVAVLSRPGTKQLAYFEPDTLTGVVRGNYSKPGLFNNDLFVVSGANLYRYAEDGTQTHIAGAINGTGRPYATWERGIGYEYLFISDGQLMQYYSGGTQATGVMTTTLGGTYATGVLTSTLPAAYSTGTLILSGSITSQVIKIGTVYYGWNAAVDTGSPNGTASKPYLCNPGSDPMTAMSNMINFIGVAGVDFSSALAAPSTVVAASSAGGPPATALGIRALVAGTSGDTIATTVYSGSGLAWGAGTLTGGTGYDTTQVLRIGDLFYGWNTAVDTNSPTGTATKPFLAKPGTNPLLALANMLNFVGTPGTDFSTAITTASTTVAAVSAGGPPATTVTLTAVTPGYAGNTIATSVYSGAGLSWSAATLLGGTLDTTQILKIGGYYYGWNAAVNTGSPDGSAAKPFLANPGTDPITAMANLLSFIGVPGTDFSTIIGGPNTLVTALAAGGPPASVLTLTAISEGVDGNSITTSVYSGTGLSWATPTLINGGVHALHGVYVPTGEGIGPLATLNSLIIAVVAGTSKFFYLRPGEVTIGALDFAAKESNPDPIVDVVTVGDFCMFIGAASMESWYSTGSQDNPLAPVAGRTVARGAVAGTSVNVKDSVVLVGDDGIVYVAGQGLTRISTHGIEERIRVQLRREKGLT